MDDKILKKKRLKKNKNKSKKQKKKTRKIIKARMNTKKKHIDKIDLHSILFSLILFFRISKKFNIS